MDRWYTMYPQIVQYYIIYVKILCLSHPVSFNMCSRVCTLVAGTELNFFFRGDSKSTKTIKID